MGLRVTKGTQTKRKKEREGKRGEERKEKGRPTNPIPHSAKGSFTIQMHLEFRVYWLSHPLNACSTAPVKLLKGRFWG